MSKLTLTDILTAFQSTDALNANNALIEAAMENTLSRDGTTPNQMEATIDLNGFYLLNQGNPITVEGFNWEGDWSNSVTYTTGDSVHNNGTAYICILESTNNEPPNATYWQVVASANLPSQIGNTNKFLQTDGTNSTWEVPNADEVSFTQNGTGAVATTIDIKLNERLTAADFGAVGDGTTDDTVAIQAAFDVGGNINIGEGSYRITGNLTITPPFNIIGKGVGLTEFIFDGLSSSIDGISIQQGSDRTINSITDITFIAKNSTGRYCITSPRGTSVFNTNTPTYHFERLKFRGDTELGLEGLYDYGWSRYLDIGDGINHVIRDVEIKGVYDYRVDPSTVTTDSTIGIYLSGIQGEGGVLMPLVDHCFIHYVGIAVQFQYVVSNPYVTNSQFHRNYRGVYSPYATVSASDYGVSECQLSELNINSQLTCVQFKKTSFLDISSVRATRADGGYNHASTWVGFDFDDVDDLKIVSTRAYNASTSYTNTHIGMQLENCDFAHIFGYHAHDNLTRGIIFHDSTRVNLVSSTFKAASASNIYFKYTAVTNPEITIIADKHVSGSTRYVFDASINSESIQFIGGKTIYESVDDVFIGVTTSGSDIATNFTVADNQVLYRQFNSGTANVTYDVDDDDVVEGDVLIFRIHTVAGWNTGSFTLRDEFDATLLTFVAAGADTYYYIEVVYTGNKWKLLDSHISLN